MIRTEWEEKISVMIRESQQCKAGDSYQFPESSWYGNNLRPHVKNTRSFLEVGVGSGIASLYMARLGLKITGVDINPDAGGFVVSDLFAELNDQKFDTIFWNHPWQFSDNITNELKMEKTFDPGYKLVERYIAEGGRHLTENGNLLLGSSCYANVDLLKLLPPSIITMQKLSQRAEKPWVAVLKRSTTSFDSIQLCNEREKLLTLNQDSLSYT